MAHIIDKHELEINKLGFNVEDFVPIVVQFGNFNLKKSDSQKKVFESETFRFVVALENEQNGKIKKWLLSAFDILKRPKVHFGLILFVTAKNIDADSLRYLRCMVKRHRKDTLF